ncbi:MAG TPA: SPW repeat protein [Candidatus Saccharimonadales bacterium]|nr:SPW repeat protein [Candidatus Saccharimonadales bacterium]
MNEGLVRWANGLSIVAALWLILSPLRISYSSTGNVWAQVIVGIIVGALAIARMSAPSVMWPSAINFLAGIWFIVAPWVLASTTADKWNQVVLGIIVAGLAALDLSTNTNPAEMAVGSGGLGSRESSMGFGERVDPRDRGEGGGRR